MCSEMNLKSFRPIPALLLLAGILLLGACGGESPSVSPRLSGNSAPYPADFYVDAVNGSDANAGTADAPFKTLTFALGIPPISGEVVKAAPGLYDGANGESFPILLPAGVVLVGDEPGKGMGGIETVINGRAPGSTGLNTAVDMGAGATLAGFKLPGDNSQTLVFANNNLVVRNNTFIGGTGIHIIFSNGAGGHWVHGNHIRDIQFGIYDDFGGTGIKVENNLITNNFYGIYIFDVSSYDFGGGAAGSSGGNILACNTNFDFYVDTWFTGGTISVQNNYWDHAPPTAADILDDSGAATIDTTGAMVASGTAPIPCL